MDGIERLGNLVAGIKHSCARSKVNSESLTFDLIQLCYFEILNIIIILFYMFPSKSLGRCFIYSVK